MNINGQEKDYLNSIKGLLAANSDEALIENMDGLQTMFKNVFFYHPDGPAVLAAILSLMNYNKKIGSLAELAVHNCAMEILTILGVRGENRTVEIVQNWIELP